MAAQGKSWDFHQQKITIGRGAENDVALTWDQKVSRYHAEINWLGNVCQITNSSQRNYLVVDGKEVQVAELKPGSQILIGDNIFKIDFKNQNEKEISTNMFTPVRVNPLVSRVEVKTNVPPAAMSTKDNFKIKTQQPTQKRNSSSQAIANANVTSYASLMMPVIVVVFFVGIFWAYKNSADSRRLPAVSKDDNLRESIEGAAKEISRIEEGQKLKTQLPIQQEYAKQHYQKGFRDYRLGQYDRALQSFQAALSFDSNHKLARKYWDLSKRKLDEKIQGFLVGSRDHLQRGNFKLCQSSAKSVMNMVKDSSDNRYREASQTLSYCDEKVGEVQ